MKIDELFTSLSNVRLYFLLSSYIYNIYDELRFLGVGATLQLIDGFLIIDRIIHRFDRAL